MNFLFLKQFINFLVKFIVAFLYSFACQVSDGKGHKTRDKQGKEHQSIVEEKVNIYHH